MLHDYFLETRDKQLPLPEKVVDWTERQSINFIAWLGRDLVHMALPKGDDEKALTVDLPELLDRPTAIYSDFMVSHLSFGPQEQGLAVDRLIAAYDALMRQSLGLEQRTDRCLSNDTIAIDGGIRREWVRMDRIADVGAGLSGAVIGAGSGAQRLYGGRVSMSAITSPATATPSATPIPA